MKIKEKTLAAMQAIVCLILIFMSTGCVYLRLLEIMNQLKDFDRNYRIEVNQVLTVHSLDPVLYSKDVLYLTKVEPSVVTEDKPGFRWTYRFEKMNKDGRTVEQGKDIIFEMVFNEQKRIYQFKFHEVFLKLAPPEFIELSLRALGNAKIDQRDRRVDANPDVWYGKKLKAPLAAVIIPRLGEPAREETVDPNRTVVYKYRLTVPEGSTIPEDKRIAEVNLVFNQHTNELFKMVIRFAGMKLSVNYQKLIERSKKMLPAS